MLKKESVNSDTDNLKLYSPGSKKEKQINKKKNKESLWDMVKKKSMETGGLPFSRRPETLRGPALAKEQQDPLEGVHIEIKQVPPEATDWSSILAG